MLIKKSPDLRESDVTPKSLYLRRREFMAAAGITAAAVASNVLTAKAEQDPSAQKLTNLKKSQYSTDEKMNSYKDVTTYNNFYEFGLDKGDPARYAHTLKPRPWSVVVEGQCSKPGTYNIEDILKYAPLEERIYRHRCVEAWSIVVPWVGYPLSEFLKRFEPTSKAKYVEFGPWSISADAGTDGTGAALAVARRPAHGRLMHRWRCWASASTAKCCRTRMARFASCCRGLRLPEHQVDRARALRGNRTAQHVKRQQASMRLLRQRQPDGRSPALVAGPNAASASSSSARR
jgi:hypothetical protein